AGDELAEGSELLCLRETFAERRALGLEPRLPRDVARYEYSSQRAAALASERRRRQQERAVERGIVDAPLHGRHEPLPRVRGFDVRERFRSDELGERPAHDVLALDADARRERVVRLHDAQLAIDDGDEIDERVERVFEQAPLPQDLVEQLNVLDADGQLP